MNGRTFCIVLLLLLVLVKPHAGFLFGVQGFAPLSSKNNFINNSNNFNNNKIHCNTRVHEIDRSFRSKMWMIGVGTRQKMGTRAVLSLAMHFPGAPLQQSTTLASVVERLDLTENFNRWKFLQNLLDEDVDARDVNEIIFVLLHNYRRNNQNNSNGDGGGGGPKVDRVQLQQDDSSAPERTKELLELIDQVLDDYAQIDPVTNTMMIPVLVDPNYILTNDDDHDINNNITRESRQEEQNDQLVAVMSVLLEQLLPDPVEKEDAHKGAWDTVLELHGRTAVALQEKEGRPAWKAVAMIARVMIYFEFLSGEGLLTPPPIDGIGVECR